MTLATPTYDLVMLLDPQTEADARAKIVSETRTAIEAKGELVRHDEWGERPLTYPIDKKTSAEYHLLQFHVGDGELLSGLDHTLRITDGLLRFRIIKLAPGVPDAPEMRSVPAPARTDSTETAAPAPAETASEISEPAAEAAPAVAGDVEPATEPEPAVAAEPEAAPAAEVAPEAVEAPVDEEPASDPA
jgi:small subunit ribosomal protein S6